MKVKTFLNGTGIFRCYEDGSVVQTAGEPVARPVEYVLSQFLKATPHPLKCVNVEGPSV